MTEHVHDYGLRVVLDLAHPYVEIACRCGKELTGGEARRRINAVDKLSVEHVRYFLHQYQLFAEKLAVYTKGWEPLRAYANILEGEEDATDTAEAEKLYEEYIQEHHPGQEEQKQQP